MRDSDVMHRKHPVEKEFDEALQCPTYTIIKGENMIQKMIDGNIDIQKDGDKITVHVPMERGEIKIIEKDMEFWERKKDELCPELYNGRRIIKLVDVSKIETNKIYKYYLFGDYHYLSGDVRDPSEMNDEALNIIKLFVHTHNTYNKSEAHGGVLCAMEYILPVFFIDGKPFDPFTPSNDSGGVKEAYRTKEGKIKKWG